MSLEKDLSGSVVRTAAVASHWGIVNWNERLDLSVSKQRYWVFKGRYGGRGSDLFDFHF